MPSAKVASSTSVPWRQPDLGVQYHPWSKVRFGGQPPHPIQWARPQGWGHLRANPWFRVFWFISSLLAEPIFSQPPLYRGFSPIYIHGVGVVLFQAGKSALGWPLRGVRFWKLSLTYPGEKPPSLSVLTHRCCLATCKPKRHLLAILNILMRIGALYEGLTARSVPSTQ